MDTRVRTYKEHPAPLPLSFEAFMNPSEAQRLTKRQIKKGYDMRGADYDDNEEGEDDKYYDAKEDDDEYDNFYKK